MLNAKIRCIKNWTSSSTLGRVYDVVDGKITMNDGIYYSGFETIKQLNNSLISKFELVTEEPEY